MEMVYKDFDNDALIIKIIGKEVNTQLPKRFSNYSLL